MHDYPIKTHPAQKSTVKKLEFSIDNVVVLSESDRKKLDRMMAAALEILREIEQASVNVEVS